jgi:hypothetical protein
MAGFLLVMASLAVLVGLIGLVAGGMARGTGRPRGGGRGGGDTAETARLTEARRSWG